MEEIPVHVEKIKELEKKNQETCQAAEVEQGDADEANDAVNSDSMEGEKFHDSDYDSVKMMMMSFFKLLLWLHIRS